MSVSLVADDAFEYVAPDFFHAFYDVYSRNYINSYNMGYGGTGVGRVNSTYNMFLNPATLKAADFTFYGEVFQKSSTQEYNEINSKNYYNNGFTGMLAISKSFVEKLNIALSFSTPNSLKYEFIRIKEIEDGVPVKRDPSINYYQTSLVSSYQVGNFQLGLSANVFTYVFEDYRYIIPRLGDKSRNEDDYGEFDRIDFSENTFRPQVGAVYNLGKGRSIGASFMPKVEQEFVVQSEDKDIPLEEYNTTIPAVFQVGVAAAKDDKIFQFDIEYEMTSQQSDMFDDRYRVKLGIEKDYGKNQIRFGISHSTSIFEGDYNMPDHSELVTERAEPGAGTGGTADDIDWLTNGTIMNQKQTIVSFGSTSRQRFGNVHFAVNRDFSNAGTVQISLGFETNFKLKPRVK
jgi:hypothetical protein